MATPKQIPDVILHLANELLEYLKYTAPWLDLEGGDRPPLWLDLEGK